MMSASGCLVYHEAARFLTIVSFILTGSSILQTAIVSDVLALFSNALKIVSHIHHT